MAPRRRGGRGKQQVQEAPIPAPAVRASTGSFDSLQINGCKDDVVGPIIRGSYTLEEKNHDRPVFRKDETVGSKALDVMLYFWEDKESPDFSGWWFGPQIGGDEVWAFHPDTSAKTPPTSGWQCPFDGPVDSSIEIVPKLVKGAQTPGRQPGTARKEIVPVLTTAEKEARRMKELELMKQHEEISIRLQEEREKLAIQRQADFERRKQLEAERKQREHHVQLLLRRALQKLRLAKPETFGDLLEEVDHLLQAEAEYLSRPLRLEAEKVKSDAKSRVLKINQFNQKIDQKKKQEEESQRQHQEANKKIIEQLEQLVEAVEFSAETLEVKMNSIQGEGLDTPTDQELDAFSEAVVMAEKDVETAYRSCTTFVRENNEAIEEVEDHEGKPGKEVLQQLLKRANVANAKRSMTSGGIAAIREAAVQRHAAAVEALERKSLAEALLEREKAIFKRYDAEGDDRLTVADAIHYARGEFGFEASPKDLERLFQQLGERFDKSCAESLPFERFHDLKVAVGIAREIVGELSLSDSGFGGRRTRHQEDCEAIASVETLRTLQQRLAESQPKLNPHSTKRAAVALIFRLGSHGEGSLAHDGRITSRNALEEVSTDAEVEVLYILRSSRQGDKWSGHVAFPGGKREASDRDDRAAAARETEEEIGLHLESPDFQFLGQLDDRVVTGGGKVLEGFYLAPVLWFQVASKTPPLQLQDSEVAAFRWVPLKTLVPEAVKFEVPLQITGELASKVFGVPASLLRLLRLGGFQGEVQLPCIDLQPGNGKDATSADVRLRATADALVLGDAPELSWPPMKFRSSTANFFLSTWCRLNDAETTFPESPNTRRVQRKRRSKPWRKRVVLVFLVSILGIFLRLLRFARSLRTPTVRTGKPPEPGRAGSLPVMQPVARDQQRQASKQDRVTVLGYAIGETEALFDKAEAACYEAKEEADRLPQLHSSGATSSEMAEACRKVMESIKAAEEELETAKKEAEELKKGDASGVLDDHRTASVRLLSRFMKPKQQLNSAKFVLTHWEKQISVTRAAEVQDFGKTAKAALRAASPKAWCEDGDPLINSTLLLFSWLAA
eukprot:symbB.v1.2.001422.t1/scaffold34.1/size402451/3